MSRVLAEFPANFDSKFYMTKRDSHLGKSFALITNNDMTETLVSCCKNRIFVLKYTNTDGDPLILNADTNVLYRPEWPAISIEFFNNNLKALEGEMPLSSENAFDFIKKYRGDMHVKSRKINGRNYIHINDGVYFNQRNLVSYDEHVVKILAPHDLEIDRYNSFVKEGFIYHFNNKKQSLTSYSLKTGLKQWESEKIFSPHTGNTRFNFNDLCCIYDISQAGQISVGVGISRNITQISSFELASGIHLKSSKIKSNLFPVFVKCQSYLIWIDGSYKIIDIN